MEMIKNHKHRYKLTSNGMYWLEATVNFNIDGEIIEPHKWVCCAHRETNIKLYARHCCAICPGYLQLTSKYPGNSSGTRVVCVGHIHHVESPGIAISELLVEEY